MNMRLLGARTIDDLCPEMVDHHALNQHIVSVPQDNLFLNTCKLLLLLSAKSPTNNKSDQPLQITKLKLESKL